MLILDEVDRQLAHALHLDARAPLAKLAEVIGTSPQTVARRYQRLREHAGLRVVGLADPGHTQRQRWLVRFTAAPQAVQEIAYALARRGDTSWIRLTSGGTEIVAVVETADPAAGADPHALLLRDVPRTASITAVSAHYLLHLYVGGPIAWRGRMNALDAGQEARLRPDTPVSPTGTVITFSPADRRLLAALRRDGRATYAELATATGWSASTVTRRVDELRERGALFFDVEIDDSLLGIGAAAMLWLSVPPVHLDRVATTLAGHPELAVVAATTGRTNLFANVLTADPRQLHHYLTTRLALPEITAVETAPVLRTLKGVA
ncbi:Lrp/AsnC family transcriptional regulator [Hamadaea tsunoensis]|uniref:Lrp/AsnC family transcriptional regulator n=1 Tax=Hamadaea tsunoensis TaxID=53368 RepID=UPI00040F60D5|nr:AsnC family transcriptional regulator [Hamadaea tsunoensis]